MNDEHSFLRIAFQTDIAKYQMSRNKLGSSTCTE
jgi:hypothetical protein